VEFEQRIALGRNGMIESKVGIGSSGVERKLAVNEGEPSSASPTFWP
jgi:hypothetical protein